MEFTYTFLQTVFWGIVLLAPILGSMASLILLAGLIVSRLENWDKFDGVYWAFITATTVGYGDIRPAHKMARVIAILISFIGLMFTGILIAISVEAATVAFERHIPETTVEILKQSIEH